ncbi:hypothetical protein H2201_000592 [Coniosporium apollinis]|uniref:Glutaredoxin domain-containing protein n=1 Tax=Coniosporium apollinis TaxID=61459 RepID=A0ABQ9P3S3_9PEZI|nr:hypothetical protein H2201_000592 [Coniosporium apollinis]
MTDLSIYDHDKTLYLFTSLTAGSSHIITATSRIETILKANKIPFQGVDTATDDLARKLYGRRAGGRKLPLLVKEGYVIGDLAEVEEWNEFGELKEAIGDVEAPKGSASSSTAAPAAAKSSSSAASTTTKTPASTPAAPAQPPQNKENAPPTQQTLAMRQLSTEAAAVGASKQTSTSTPKPQQPTFAQTPSAVPKEAPPASAAGEPNPTSRRRSSIPAPPEEIKAVEQALAIPEEEEDDSEEGDDEDEDDEDDEDENDDEDEDEDEEEKVGAQRADAAAPPAAAGTGSGNGEGVKKGGDAAAAEKAGESVLD